MVQCGHGFGYVDRNVLPAMDLSGECDPRLAHSSQPGYESRVCARASSELGTGQTTDSLGEARRSFAPTGGGEPQVVIWEQRQQDLLAQVTALETIGQSGEPRFLAIKAQQLEAEWEVHHRRVLLEATSVGGKRELNHCEKSCRALRHVLRQQEDLRACQREMQELDNTKDQLMTLLKVGLANLGLWVRDHYFGESYQTCGWERLLPFFQLSGWITATETEVRLDFSPFNHRAMARDLQELCRTANTSGVHLPDGRRLVFTVGQRRSGSLNGPLAPNTG